MGQVLALTRSASFLLLHDKLLQPWWLETTPIYYLRASVCHESAHGLARGLLLRPSESRDLEVSRAAFLSGAWDPL